MATLRSFSATILPHDTPDDDLVNIVVDIKDGVPACKQGNMAQSVTITIQGDHKLAKYVRQTLFEGFNRVWNIG